MSSVIVVLVVAVLTMVAALGIVTPYRRRGIPALEPLADPLEDRRLALLIALRDLESAHGSGAIEEADYLRLRDETEGRMGKILRALEERSREPAPHGNGGVSTPRRTATRRWVAVALVAVLALSAALVPALLRSLHDGSAGASALTGADSLSYFERRVKAHPRDVAARLDLAHRYLDAGRFGQAFAEYRAALRLDPGDADALAHIGFLLHLSGKPGAALAAEQKALSIDRAYPNALFYRGLILLKGLHRPAPAVRSLQAYLDASPYGPDGSQARALLAEARAQAGSG